MEVSVGRIAMVAGEASGDLLATLLIGGLRERWPELRLEGIGGPKMVAAGFDAWWPLDQLSVMGYVDALKNYREIAGIRRQLKKRLLETRPDIFIGVDAPDFNLGLETELKAAGIRTIHYVSPSIWAWRPGRAKKIGASADRVLCLFPMEPPIYERHGVAARFVGHPLAERFALAPDRVAARDALGIPHGARVVALLPGSRGGEIARLGPVFLAAAALLCERVPGLRFVAPMANARRDAQFRQLLAASAVRDATTVLDGKPHEAMVAADAVLLASGTAALEAMLAKRAMVVAYKLAPLTHWLVRTLGLMRIDRYSLPNVLAGETLVPELMQHAATPEAIADAVAIALDPATEARLVPRFRAIHEALRILLCRPDLRHKVHEHCRLLDAEVEFLSQQADALRQGLADIGYPRLHVEQPIEVRLSDGGSQSIILDLIAEGSDGFLVVDHKSGPVSDHALRFERYWPQLAAYIDAVDERGGKAVRAAAVFWTETGELTLGQVLCGTNERSNLTTPDWGMR